MKALSGKEKCILAVLAALLAGGIFHASDKILVHGIYARFFRYPEYISMIAELAVLFVLFAVIGRRVTNRRKRSLYIGAVMAVFLWIHVILLPLLVSGLYLLYICFLGRKIRCALAKAGSDQKECLTDTGRDFLIGSMAVICVFCLMSAVDRAFGIRIGSIPAMWCFVLASGLGMLAWELMHGSVRAGRRKRAEAADSPSLYEITADGAWSVSTAVGVAFVLMVFCLQAGRLNLALDYDTMWYGVRAPYILNNGRGIYENLGTLAVVYTYSKGWETLTLPLSILPSYAFLMSASLWMGAGMLAAAYQIGRYFMNRRRSGFFVAFLASLPVLMNMSISAKTDMAALYVQLLMILELLRFLLRRDGRDAGQAEDGRDAALYYSVAALVLSWLFKPTAMVFSTAVYGMSFLYLLFRRRFSFWCAPGARAEAAGAVFLTLGSTVGIWARTWLLTGVPVTSIFSGFFLKLGFHLKYPYSAKPVPNSAAEMTLAEKAGHMLSRLYGLVLSPHDEADMSHVLMAWGCMAIWFFFWMALAWLFLEKTKERSSRERLLDGWLGTVFWPYAAVNFVSLYLLGQVDGNYFMLLYILITLGGFRLLGRLKARPLRDGAELLMLPAMAFAMVLMTMSNWAWSMGFTPVNLIHRGYYRHQDEQQVRMTEQGSGEIWEILAQDPRTRVIAVADHPTALLFPCCVQSFTDITSNNGNLAVAMTAADFAEFMEYAGTEYVYTDSSWLGGGEWTWGFMSDLVEQGYLKPIYYNGDKMLAEVHTNGIPEEEAAAAFERFQRDYLFRIERLYPQPDSAVKETGE